MIERGCLFSDSTRGKPTCSHLTGVQPKTVFSPDDSGGLSSTSMAWGPGPPHLISADPGCCCGSSSSSLPGFSFPRPSLSLSLSSPKMSSTCFRTEDPSLASHGWIISICLISDVQQVVWTDYPSLWIWTLMWLKLGTVAALPHILDINWTNKTSNCRTRTVPLRESAINSSHLLYGDKC